MPPSDTAVLTRALRAIRRRRGLTARQVAEAMGLALRTYQHFEASCGPLDLARLAAFATATDCDLYALVAAVMMDRPEFAVRCLDNKLASILAEAVRRFDARQGDRLAQLEVVRLIAAFRRVFDELERDLAAREAEAADWLGGAGPPRPPD